MILITISLLLLTLISSILYVYTHWKRKGFPYIAPTIPFGNLMLTAKNKTSFGVNIYELYKSVKDPFIGIYLLFRPAILIRDAELVQRILTTDFNQFHDRGVYCNPEYDPLSENLFAMEGQRWKEVRAKISPAFTSGKIKTFMMPAVMEQSNKLIEYVDTLFSGKHSILELKDVVSKFTLNVIASALFGIDIDTFADPDNEFRQNGLAVKNSGLRARIKVLATFLCPKILEIFRSKSTPEKIEQYFTGIVKRTIEHRERNEIVRKDFMQCLIDLRNEERLISKDKLPISVETCAAQLFIFYIAGFESTSSAIAYCLFELSRQPEMMQKVQTEIDTVLEKYENELTFESILEMKYLDLCIQETFRKYPFPILNRICTTTYQIPNSKYKIEKGTAIIISLLGLMRDAQYFPEPEKFNPDRFLNEHKNYNPMANIPFGDGPRFCVGARFGKLVVQIGLIKMLQKYKFKSYDNKEIEFSTSTVGLLPKEGVKVIATKRQ